MNIYEALSFLVRINIRILETALIIAHFVAGGDKNVKEIIDENQAWIEKEMREAETQMMIDELYE